MTAPPCRLSPYQAASAVAMLDAAAAAEAVAAEAVAVAVAAAVVPAPSWHAAPRAGHYRHHSTIDSATGP